MTIIKTMIDNLYGKSKMKQVNMLIDEELLEHVEKLVQLISILNGKEVTFSDLVIKTLTEYSKYGQVIIESKYNDQKLELTVLPATPEGYQTLPNDELINKICRENWKYGE